MASRQRPATCKSQNNRYDGYELVNNNVASHEIIEMPTSKTRDTFVAQGITAVGNGDHRRAQRLFRRALEADASSVEAWLWLSRVMENDAARELCLRKALMLEPTNEATRSALTRLTGRRLKSPPDKTPLHRRRGGGSVVHPWVLGLAALCGLMVIALFTTMLQAAPLMIAPAQAELLGEPTAYATLTDPPTAMATVTDPPPSPTLAAATPTARAATQPPLALPPTSVVDGALTAQAEITPFTTSALTTTPNIAIVAESDTPSTVPQQGRRPTRIVIPAIKVDATVTPMGQEQVTVVGKTFNTWSVPDAPLVGWHETSARLGIPGNTVLNGHNWPLNAAFRELYKLEEGARIEIYAGDIAYTYTLAETVVALEAGQPLDVRLNNAQYILPTHDERVTLITCHPYGSTANRLLLIAYPTDRASP